MPNTPWLGLHLLLRQGQLRARVQRVRQRILQVVVQDVKDQLGVNGESGYDRVAPGDPKLAFVLDRFLGINDDADGACGLVLW